MFRKKKVMSTSYSVKTFNVVRDYLATANHEGLANKISIGPTSRFATIRFIPEDSFNEVYPGIFIGDQMCVKDKVKMQLIGVTHIVNCSQGSGVNQVNTDKAFYRDVKINFLGIQANDISSFDMTPFFNPAAKFIDEALANDGKVFVHCIMGISRSSAIVIAFLMLKRGMTLFDAVKVLRAKRQIFPNDGFLRQLCILEASLSEANRKR